MKNNTSTHPFRLGKLAFGAVGFVLLTGGVFWHQFSRVPADAAAPTWNALRWDYLALIVLCLPVESVTCGLRTWAMTRILQPSVSLWTCIKAEWANVAISTLTPTQSWGGPGQVYVLSRGGASVGTSMTIMLLSCIATLIALLVLAIYSLFVANTAGAWPLFLTVICSFVGVGSAMAAVAIWPSPLRAALASLSRAAWRLRGRRQPLGEWWPPDDVKQGPSVDRMGPLTARLVDIIYTYRADVSRFLRQGKSAFACVCLLSLPFPISRVFIAFSCIRFLGIEGSDFRHIFEAQLILILLEFFAPSPGGAGVMEMASLAVMRDLVSTGYAPYYNLLWRTSTLYVTALAGFACLAVALLQDARRAMRPTWKQPNARTGFPPADTLAPTPSRDCLHSADDPHSAAAGRHQSRGPDQGVELPLRMRRRRALWLVILTMASVMTPGCVGVARPIPEIDGRLVLQVSSEKLSSRPFGVYQIPDTSVYVSGHQGGASIGMLFGPIGLLAGHAAARSTGEMKTKEAEAQLRLNLPKLTEHALAQAIEQRADRSRFALTRNAAAATLEIKPYLVVNFIGSDQARLWVVLRAILKGTSHEWKTQYIAGVGGARPISGAKGWAADDAAALRDVANRNLQFAVDVLLRDTSAALPRDRGRFATVTSNWLWLKTPRSRQAMVLDETGTTVVVLPCMYEDDANAFGFTGVTILDKQAVVVKSQSTQPCLGKYLDINPE